MKPTTIQIHKLSNPKGPTTAFVTITFDDMMVVRDFRIVNGKNGTFLAMPSAPDKEGKFRDKLYFVDAFKDGTPGQEFRNKLQAAVLKKWRDMDGGPAFEDQTTSSGETTIKDGVPF